ncbi:hypothetical protein JYQ62_33340 [Nostoc sp. UHCC 0702]|nr:hypothetical protein JYQ62_33340 [Nostoc sp. UHCC 0702]
MNTHIKNSLALLILHKFHANITVRNCDRGNDQFYRDLVIHRLEEEAEGQGGREAGGMRENIPHAQYFGLPRLRSVQVREYKFPIPSKFS